MRCPNCGHETTLFNPYMLIVAREVRGLSQFALAARSGVPQSRISRIEGGLLAPGESDLQKLASALNFPAAWFQQVGIPHPENRWID